MTNKNKRKQRKAQQAQQAQAQQTQQKQPASTDMKAATSEVSQGRTPKATMDESYANRKITGWHDILELAADAGLKPIGPTFQSGANFGAAFEIGGCDTPPKILPGMGGGGPSQGERKNSGAAATGQSNGSQAPVVYKYTFGQSAPDVKQLFQDANPKSGRSSDQDEDDLATDEEAKRNNMLLKTFLSLNSMGHPNSTVSNAKVKQYQTVLGQGAGAKSGASPVVFGPERPPDMVTGDVGGQSKKQEKTVVGAPADVMLMTQRDKMIEQLDFATKRPEKMPDSEFLLLAESYHQIKAQLKKSNPKLLGKSNEGSGKRQAIVEQAIARRQAQILKHAATHNILDDLAAQASTALPVGGGKTKPLGVGARQNKKQRAVRAAANYAAAQQAAAQQAAQSAEAKASGEKAASKAFKFGSSQRKEPMSEFMGFPLAGGPNDDVSSFLSRDLFQQHLDKSSSRAAKPAKNAPISTSDQPSGKASQESVFSDPFASRTVYDFVFGQKQDEQVDGQDGFDYDLFNPFVEQLEKSTSNPEAPSTSTLLNQDSHADQDSPSSSSHHSSDQGLMKKPTVAASDTPIALPYYQPSVVKSGTVGDGGTKRQEMTKQSIEQIIAMTEFELYDDFSQSSGQDDNDSQILELKRSDSPEGTDDLFMTDNAALLMKLRESERNRKQKLREAASRKTQATATSKQRGGATSFAEGLFGPRMANPFAQSGTEKGQAEGANGAGESLSNDFWVAEFENLLKQKPREETGGLKQRGVETQLLIDDSEGQISHLNLNSTRSPFVDLYDRFDDFDDPTYLINQVYYTDCEATLSEDPDLALSTAASQVTRDRESWLQDAYRDFLLHLTDPFSDSQVRAKPLINNLFADDRDLGEPIGQNPAKPLPPSADDKIRAMTGPKLYLLKLVEFNKIAVLEKYANQSTEGGGPDLLKSFPHEDEVQLAEVQACMTKLMRQTLIRDELRHVLEDYEFEGSQAEQKAVVFSLVKMSKKLINILYKKCFAFTLVKYKSTPQPYNFASIINFSSSTPHGGGQKSAASSGHKVTEVLWKDCLQESREYIAMLQKLAELYEHVLDKAQFFRKFLGQIFVSVPTYRHLSLDALFKGFFFVFVYKDFIVREVTGRVHKHLHQVSKRHNILAKVEQDYLAFMEADLTCWVALMLECDVFQSYQSIVAPNESIQTDRSSSKRTNYTSSLKGETANFVALQKRYIRGFLAAYNRCNPNHPQLNQPVPQSLWSFRPSTTQPGGGTGSKNHFSAASQMMYLVDSDFDDSEEQCMSGGVVAPEEEEGFIEEMEDLEMPGFKEQLLGDEILDGKEAQPVTEQTQPAPSAQSLKNKKKKLKRKAKKEKQRMAAALADRQDSLQQLYPSLIRKGDSAKSTIHSPRTLAKKAKILERISKGVKIEVIDDYDDFSSDEDDEPSSPIPNPSTSTAPTAKPSPSLVHMSSQDQPSNPDESKAQKPTPVPQATVDTTDDGRLDFKKEFTMTHKKIINGEEREFVTDRTIVAFGNGNLQMCDEMTQFVNQIASLTQKSGMIEVNPSQGPGAAPTGATAGKKSHKVEAGDEGDTGKSGGRSGKGQGEAGSTSYISERRNKKRKELAQSIFDASPFNQPGGPLSQPFGPGPLPSAQQPIGTRQPGQGMAKDFSKEVDALKDMSSLFGSFRLPEQLANLPQPKPWKPKHKQPASAKPAQTSTALPVDDIFDDSSDDGATNMNQQTAGETTGTAQQAEEKKKKKNRRKKRTRKQKQLMLQQQVLKENGKCQCECHSGLATALLAVAKSAAKALQETGGDGKESNGRVQTEEGLNNSVGQRVSMALNEEQQLQVVDSKAVGWQGCSHAERGCKAGGDCAQEDETLTKSNQLNGVDAQLTVEEADMVSAGRSSSHSAALKLQQQLLQQQRLQFGGKQGLGAVHGDAGVGANAQFGFPPAEHLPATESDVEFDEQLRNFELRLRSQHSHCSVNEASTMASNHPSGGGKVIATPNSSSQQNLEGGEVRHSTAKHQRQGKQQPTGTQLSGKRPSNGGSKSEPGAVDTKNEAVQDQQQQQQQQQHYEPVLPSKPQNQQQQQHIRQADESTSNDLSMVSYPTNSTSGRPKLQPNLSEQWLRKVKECAKKLLQSSAQPRGAQTEVGRL